MCFPGYALDPTVDCDNEGKSVVGATLAAEESAMKTVFEATAKRPLDKRKRQKNDDAADIEGFLGPWGCFTDEKRVMKPNEVRILLQSHMATEFLIYTGQRCYSCLHFCCFGYCTKNIPISSLLDNIWFHLLIMVL